MSDERDWLEDQVAERREQQARLDAELDEIIADTLPDGQADAPAPAKPDAIAEAQPDAGGNVLMFRPASKWPHPWNSPNKWHGSGWNAGTVWKGAPRVLISNRSARPTGTDDDEPPTPPMAA